VLQDWSNDYNKKKNTMDIETFAERLTDDFKPLRLSLCASQMFTQFAAQCAAGELPPLPPPSDHV
jgi:hypothetical protein